MLRKQKITESRKYETQIKNEDLVERRRLQIATGAAKLFIEKGYFSTNMRDISKATGITIGSLYDYITKKEDILCLVFDVFHSLVEKIFVESGVSRTEDPVKQLRASIEKALEFNATHKDMVALIYSESRTLPKDFLKTVLEKENMKVKYFEGILKRGVKKGVFSAKDPFLEASIIVYLLFIVPLRGWTFRGRYTVDEINLYITESILDRLQQIERTK